MSLVAETVQERLSGVAVGLLTPFDDALQVEHDKLRENAQTLYGEGIRTFLATANISEYHSLSHEERIAVVKTSVDELPGDACVLAGVGGSVRGARSLIEAYDGVGVDAMMIMPPDHTYLHEEGLLEYYRKLDDVTETPLVPYVRGIDPSVEYLAALSRIDGVVGIKYAIPDAVKLGAAIEAGSDEIAWVDGLAEPYAVSFWAEGIDGFSAGVSNFRPEVGLALYDALESGEWARARALKNACLPYQQFREQTGEDNTISGGSSVAAVKAALELRGLHGGAVRVPCQPLTQPQQQRAKELYDRLDEDIARLI
ncbi:dihydrodipicolinate synthase family protein [Halocatena halophila]|uniref:dihydrodipicolinate synthase family protein n=1 Tax=Halocatena halophila TaxID=2814576 RepID=UPI002ED04766